MILSHLFRKIRFDGNKNKKGGGFWTVWRGVNMAAFFSFSDSRLFLSKNVYELDVLYYLFILFCLCLRSFLRDWNLLCVSRNGPAKLLRMHTKYTLNQSGHIQCSYKYVNEKGGEETQRWKCTTENQKWSGVVQV